VEVQSLSICVPGKCVNNCAYCVSQMHESPYQDRVKTELIEYTYSTPAELPRALKDYYKRLKFGRDNGTNSIVITGSCEPLQHKSFLRMFASLNGMLPSPYLSIDLQTTGVFLTDANLDWLRDEIGVTTIALSIADIFDRQRNFDLQVVPEKLRFNIVDLCDKIREKGFTLRLCLNLTDVYKDCPPENLFAAAHQMGAEQLVLRQMFAETGGTTEKDNWIREHALPVEPLITVNYMTGEKRPVSWVFQHASELIGNPCSIVHGERRGDKGLTVWDINGYIRERGKALDILPYGATRYSVHGMSTVLDDSCMAQNNGTKQTLRYLVLREDGRLYSRWDDISSLLF